MQLILRDAEIIDAIRACISTRLGAVCDADIMIELSDTGGVDGYKATIELPRNALGSGAASADIVQYSNVLPVTQTKPVPDVMLSSLTWDGLDEGSASTFKAAPSDPSQPIGDPPSNSVLERTKTVAMRSLFKGLKKATK